MTRKRSRYRPGAVNPLAHKVALMGAQRLHRDDALQFALPVREAVQRILAGRADTQHWDALLRALSVAEQLVRQKVARDTEGFLPATRAMTLDILQREATRGTRALYPQEVARLDAFGAEYADLIAQVTNSELFAAEEAVTAHAQKYPRTD